MAHIRGDPIVNLELEVLRIQISSPFPIVPSFSSAITFVPKAIPTHFYLETFSSIILSVISSPIMTFNGSIKAAISQALTDSKLLVVFLKDNSEASYQWQTQLLTDKEVFGARAPESIILDTDLFFGWIVL